MFIQSYITFIIMFEDHQKVISYDSLTSLKENQQKSKNQKVKLRLVIKFPLTNLQFLHNYRNAFYVNDQAVRSPEQSSPTIFQGFKEFQKIKKIQSNRHYFSIKVDSSLPEENIKIDYMIERFLSFGDTYFSDFANKIMKLQQNLQEIKTKINQSSNPSWKQSFREILNKYQNKRVYMVCWQPFQNKKYQITSIKFSQLFLQMLGQDSQSLSVTLLKHQNLEMDVFNPDIYKALMMAHLDNINLYADRILNFKQDLNSDLSEMTQNTYYIQLIRKDEGKILAEVKITMPHFYVHVGEVTKIIRQDPPSRMQRGVQQIPTKKQYQTISNLVQVPKNLLSEQRHKICKYRDIQPSI